MTFSSALASSVQKAFRRQKPVDMGTVMVMYAEIRNRPSLVGVNSAVFAIPAVWPVKETVATMRGARAVVFALRLASWAKLEAVIKISRHTVAFVHDVLHTVDALIFDVQSRPAHSNQQRRRVHDIKRLLLL